MNQVIIFVLYLFPIVFIVQGLLMFSEKYIRWGMRLTSRSSGVQIKINTKTLSSHRIGGCIFLIIGIIALYVVMKITS